MSTFDSSRFARNLLRWFKANKRDLPFRGTSDPYAIWVSETMLQQTQVATVVPYFTKFMARFPDIESLASVDIDDVLAEWAGLGYYRRARYLHAGARAVVERHAGVFPQQIDEVLALPGIGRYTAGAILSIAFDQTVPILDGNVGRVLTRLFELKGDPSKGPTNKELWQLAEELIPKRKAGDFNQSLMELGALICTPKSPDCERCPVRNMCSARSNASVDRFPESPTRAKTHSVHVAAAVIHHNSCVLVCKRPEDEVNGGMWEFPNIESKSKPSAKTLASLLPKHFGIEVDVEKRLGQVKHSIMNRRFVVDVFLCRARNRPAKLDSYAEVRWVRSLSLEKYAMASAPNQIRKMILEDGL